MKKLIAKIVTLVLSVTIVLSMFAACDWVTTVVDRDMNQVVATVNISKNPEDAELKGKLDDENIYKRDLVAGYMSYGYQYVSSYGYTTSQAYQVVLDNVVNNKVITQLARYELSKANADIKLNFTENDKTGLEAAYVLNLKQYLTEYEWKNSLYLVRSSVNSMVETFMDEDADEDETEDETFTARTTPTVEEDEDEDEAALKARKATDYEIKVVEATLGYDEDGAENADFTALVATKPSVYDLNMFLYDNYKIDFGSTREIKQASSKLFDYLETNGLNNEGDRWAKGDAKKSEKERYYDVKDPDKSFNCTYFESLLVSRLESALISNYEDSLISQAESEKLSNDGLWAQYGVEYKTQEALYRSDISSYETALGNVSDTSFVLYTPYNDAYGYVTNLLIGFTDEQKALLTNYSSKVGVKESDVTAYRAKLLNDLKAYDQRASWVQNNYGTYAETETSKTFTFDDDYRVSSLDNVKNFIGTVTAKDAKGVVADDDNGVKKTNWTYSEVTPTKLGFTDFYTTYVQPVLGDAKYFENSEDFGMLSAEKVSALFDENGVYDQFNDLLFAFSTDTGCLNKEYGYLYSDFTSATTYVKEFAAAAKKVVKEGVGAYTIVATEYGYHIILCTKKITNAPYAIDDAGKTQFLADLAQKGTLAYNYREVKKNAVVSTEINKIVEEKINPFVDDESDRYAITLYKKTYSDLITEEEDS